jgi:hypothetical protein
LIWREGLIAIAAPNQKEPLAALGQAEKARPIPGFFCPRKGQEKAFTLRWLASSGEEPSFLSNSFTVALDS